MITADAQLGIAKYLHGGTCGNQQAFSKFDLYDKFEPLGLSVMGTRPSEIQRRVLEYCTFEAQRSMEENGLNVYSVCKGCANFDEKTDVYEESLSEKIFFRSFLSCRRGGCDKARKEFIENVTKMEREDDAEVLLTVEMEPASPEVHYGRFGELAHEAHIMPSFKEDRIKIHAERKDRSPRYSDFFSTGEVAQYAKPKKPSFEEALQRKRKEEQEIESQLDFLMKDQVCDYGVEVW